MAIDKETLAVSMAYTKATAEGQGAIKGDKGDKGDPGPKGDKGDTGEQGPKGDTGRGILSVDAVLGESQIVVEYDDGTQSSPIDIPTVKGDKGDTGEQGPKGDPGENGQDGADGEDGFSPQITVKESTSETYKLHIKTADDEYDTPNLKGGGSGGTSDYADLDNKPKINGNTVNAGNQTGASLDLADLTVTDALDVRVTALEENPVNPIQFTTMPEATEHPEEVVQFIGSTTSTYTRGYFYRSTPVVVAGSLTYEWRQTDTQPSNSDYDAMQNRPLINGTTLTGDKSSVQLGLQGQFQFDTMPTADATNLGTILQYVGGTSLDYVSGYFYQSRYDSATATYGWANIDVSSNAALATAVQILQANQGNMADLEVAGVSTLVAALNKVNAKSVNNLTYTEPYLYINYNDGSTITFSVTNILNETQIGELANVIDDTITDGQILQWDAAIARYKPYALLTTLTQLLTDSKDYTDTKIAEAIVAGAYVCDEKPSYDAQNDTVIYKQGGVTKTTTQTDARFYYYSDGDPYCTSWIDDVEFTFSVADVDFDDYVNKDTDVVSTYTESMLDKTKIPDVAALDALLAIVKASLALKINTDSIEDSLTSQDATKVLSAKQGYVLKGQVDTKQDIVQYAVVPTAASAIAGKVIQYIGVNAGAFENGYFYRCVQNASTLDWEWQEIKYATDADDHLDANSTNPIQNAVTTTELGKKLEKVAALPTATVDRLDACYLLTATQTGYKLGGIYKCTVVAGSDPAEYEWTLISSANLQEGDGIDITNDTISVVNRLTEIDELPTASVSNLDKCYLLTDTQTGYKKGGIYQCQVVPETSPVEYEWTLISSSPLEAGPGIVINDDIIASDIPTFVGTDDEWEALPASEKEKYGLSISTDDEAHPSYVFADSPVGTILPYGGSTPPSGWFLCQGQAVSRTTYAELFAVIGTSFGVGDGSTTFNIPDMRESVPKGAGETGQTVGAHVKSGGLAVGEFLDDRIQDHRHTLPLGTAAGGDAVMLAQNTLIDNTGVVENDYRKGDTTEVKSVGVNYIIKAKMVALPADLASGVEDVVEDVYGDIIPSDASASNKLPFMAKGDNAPFVSNITILNYLNSLPSDTTIVSFATSASATSVTDRASSTKGCYYEGMRIGTSWQITAKATDLSEFWFTTISNSASSITWEKLVTESDLPKQFVITNGGELFPNIMGALGLSGYPNRVAYEVFGSTSNKCYSKGIAYRANSSASCDIFGYTSNCFIATNNGGAIAVYDEARTTPLSDATIVFTRI